MSGYNILPPFSAPGPVAAAWISDATTRMPFITGPAGSGKTTAAVYRGPYYLARHMPICKDGVVRARMTVIRDNYRRLAETALKSWKLVFKEDFPFSAYSGGQDRPVHHKIELQVVRGWSTAGVQPGGEEASAELARLFPRQPRLFELEVDFFAVGDHAIEEMLRGYETSYGWANEADLLDERVAPFLFSRTGRHPSRLHLPDELVDLLEHDRYKIPRQVAGDLNPPDVEHWVAKWTKENHAGFKLYRQPSGLAPNAENRKGKSRSDYESDLLTLDPYDAKRFVYGEFGYARDGIPVYPEFNEGSHCAPLKPVREIPIDIGLDAGGTPSAVFTQTMPNGQKRVLQEIVTEPITGAARFSELMLVTLHGRFAGIPVGRCYGDPSAFYGADRMNGELAWMETVALAIGHNIEPAPSNELGIRIDAVKILLKSRIDGQTECLLIDPEHCPMLVGGFVAHYKIGKDTRGKIINGGLPVKNPYSHPHDALQYDCLGTRGRAGVVTESARAGRAGNVVPITSGKRPSAEFNVFDV